MVILGLSGGITNSTAALMIDGRLVACCSEERFNHIKNYDGWPEQAINNCIKIAGIEAKDIDYIATGMQESLFVDGILTHRFCRFSVEDFIKEQEAYWYPKLYEGRENDYLQLFSDKIDIEQFPGKKYLKAIKEEHPASKRDSLYANLKPRLPEIQLGINADKNRFLNHHSCHAAYAAYAMKHNANKLLVFTLDGSGDDENATVSVLENGKIKKLYGTDKFILGRLYRHATLMLGMKMVEHEYKVMGLSSYAKNYHSDRPYAVYSNTLRVNGLDVEFIQKPSDSYFYFIERLKGARFDGIAGGIQRFLEDRLCEWIGNWMAHTGIRNICFSGGVSMNVKANLAIQKRCQPQLFLVPGSGADESCAIGACYQLALQKGEDVMPLSDMYLGDAVTDRDGKNAAEALNGDERYTIVDAVADHEIAKLLARGKIIGRCCGRMEFGARALGNRSILADPRRSETVRIINDKIKNRDFWMPFAPSILHEQADAYIHRYEGVDYSCMTVAAESTTAGKNGLRAALHPADDTARPHIVIRERNPEYYALIREFEKLTDVGGVLNTSLNIHGFPIVRTADDAIHVFQNTGIDGIVIGKTLFLKK